jgi:hypothetical protein
MSKMGKIGKIEKIETVSESDDEIELKPTITRMKAVINHVANSDEEACQQEPPKKDRKKYSMTKENRLLKVESIMKRVTIKKLLMYN